MTLSMSACQQCPKGASCRSYATVAGFQCCQPLDSSKQFFCLFAFQNKFTFLGIFFGYSIHQSQMSHLKKKSNKLFGVIMNGLTKVIPQTPKSKDFGEADTQKDPCQNKRKERTCSYNSVASRGMSAVPHPSVRILGEVIKVTDTTNSINYVLIMSALIPRLLS